MNQHNTFADWLQTATRGLPKNVLPLVQAELRAHYDDALEDYILGGKSQREAQDAALADLGNVEETANALQQIHLAPRRYLLAAVACILPLLFLIIGIPIFVIGMRSSVLILLLYPISFGCTIYVLDSFSKLLPYHKLRLPINIMLAGTFLNFAMLILTSFFGKQLGIASRWTGLYFNEVILNYAFLSAQSYNDVIVDTLIMGAIIITALGSLLFGWRIMRVSDALTQVLGFSFIGSGIIMLLHISAIIARNPAATSLFPSIVMLAMQVKYTACALLFFRAARGGSAFPTRTA